MTTTWNNRGSRFDPSKGNDQESFLEHAKCMTGFRRSHADVVMVNGPRCDESALLESTKLLQVHLTTIEMGGARLGNGTTDWSALVSVLKVPRYKLSLN